VWELLADPFRRRLVVGVEPRQHVVPAVAEVLADPVALGPDAPVAPVLEGLLGNVETPGPLIDRDDVVAQVEDAWSLHPKVREFPLRRSHQATSRFQSPVDPEGERG
jgi:hypothetical protein